jgi:RNA polymerase sigma-70 factor (ECF subfamily)
VHPFVERGVMSANADLPAGATQLVDFDAFYDSALPVVFGYLLRLCGGDRDHAWDLTQDTWLTVVDQLALGNSEKMTIGFLLSVARSRYLDAWRRNQRLQRKLRLVWATDRPDTTDEPATDQVLDHIAECSERHRVVLMLAYVDDVPVAEIARQTGTSLSATYALLARARDELRAQINGGHR